MSANSDDGTARSDGSEMGAGSPPASDSSSANVAAPVMEVPALPADPYVSSVIAADGQNAEISELRSQDGRFRFVVEDDARLVLYMESDSIWARYPPPEYAGRSNGNAKLVLQNDGNMLISLETPGCTWSIHTANAGPAPFTLTMHNNGNCALCDAYGMEHWCTRTMGWG